MSLTAGTITVGNVTDVTINVLSTAATSGSSPYTYQWYRSTVSGFTPGSSTLISGATSLTLQDKGLKSGVIYYYVIVVTDSIPNVADSAQVSVQTQNAAFSGEPSGHLGLSLGSPNNTPITKDPEIGQESGFRLPQTSI
jgi:hypothetical protein